MLLYLCTHTERLRQLGLPDSAREREITHRAVCATFQTLWLFVVGVNWLGDAPQVLLSVSGRDTSAGCARILIGYLLYDMTVLLGYAGARQAVLMAVHHVLTAACVAYAVSQRVTESEFWYLVRMGFLAPLGGRSA